VNTEKIFLGSCIKDAALVDLAIQDGLNESYFTSVERKDLWVAILTSRAENRGTDVTALYLSMGKTCPMNEILECENAAPTTAFGKQSLRQVLEAGILRQVKPAVEDIANRIADESPYADIKAEVDNLQLIMRPTEHREESMKDILGSALNWMDKSLQDTGVEDDLIFTGLSDFDNAATGIQSHEYVVIGARTSTGKSSFINQMAAFNLGRGKRVAMFTLETSSRAVVLQMSAQVAEVNLRHLRDEFPIKVQRLRDKVNSLYDKPLVIFDRDLTLDQIEARCRLLAVNFKPDVVFIDYMGLIGMKSASKNGQYEKMTALSKAMIPLRKTLDCALVVAAQLNRGNERDNRAPARTDFRDSGSIEEDAHRIIALHRPVKDSAGLEQDINGSIFETELIQLKMRDGPLGKTKCKFIAKYTKFTET